MIAFILRLLNECGEIFCNGKVATTTTLIPNGARIGLFSIGMHLLCGGQHLKGHGFITKKPTKKRKPKSDGFMYG